jgi:hypothetical protein
MMNPQNSQQHSELQEMLRLDEKLTRNVGENTTAHMANNLEVLSRHIRAASTGIT